jgi:thiol-disulfide isomerase/thioredoxin
MTLHRPIIIVMAVALALGLAGALYDYFRPGPAARTTMATPPLTPALQSIAPAFSMRTLDGQTTALAKLQGKVVILNLWATWCPPCLVEFPMLIDLVNKLDGQVVLVALSSDRTAGPVRTFLDQMATETNTPLVPPHFWIGLDEGRRITRDLYRVTTYPESFIIAPNGTVARHIIGIDDWKRAETEAFIRGLIPTHNP